MALRFDVVPPEDRDLDEGPRALLQATVAAGDLARARPATRIELAPGRLSRLVADGHVVFWARVKSFHEGVWVLAAGGSEPRRELVAPISMSDVRGVTFTPGTDAWTTAWARHFADGLASSPRSVLHPGTWQIAAADVKLRDPRRSVADAQGQIDLHGARGPLFETWALNGSNATLPLRAPSPHDGGRVKALRKLARAGTLPPLLLWFVSGLDMHVLLDGHDRALAAHLEGTTVSRLVVSSVREVRWEPDAKRQEGELRRAEVVLARAATNTGELRRSVFDAIQTRLVRAFAVGRCRVPKTRAFPLPGGAARWRREVAARLAALGVEPDHAMLTGR